MRTVLVACCLLAGALHAAPDGMYRLTEWIELRDHPRALAYDSTGKRLLATGGRAGFGYLVGTDDTADAASPQASHAMESIVSLAATESGLFLADRAGGMVQHLPRGQEPPQQTRVGQYTGAIAVAPDETFLCVLSGCDWHPGVHDTGGALHILPLPLGRAPARVCPIPEPEYGEPRSLCVSRDGRTAYVATSPTDYGAATILAVDLGSARIRAQHTVSEPCIWVSRNSLVLSPAGEPILAIDGREESRLVLFSAKLVPRRSLALGRGPTTLAVNPDGLRGIVASRGASRLQILDLAEFTLGGQFASPIECPSLVTFGAGSDRLFVGSSYVPKIACLEYSAEPPPTAAPAETERGEERIAWYVLDEGNRALWTARPDGTDRRLLARLPVTGLNFVLRLSPDGRRLLYAWKKEQVCDLFVLDLATGESRRLTDVRKDKGVACMGVVGTAFLPHGRAIVYELEFTIHEKVLVVMGAQGGDAYPLVDNYDDLDTCPVPHPWDPDRLLFLYDSGNWTYNREVRLFDRDTDTDWVIRPRDGHTPTDAVWSPDGRRIYWGRTGTEFRSATNLWSMRPDGSAAEPLVSPISTPGTDRLPTAASPDGRLLLVDARKRDDRDLYVADLGTRTLRQFMDTGQYEVAFAWQRMVLPPTPVSLP